ncbi:MAG: peptidylprolyl isomerase [Bacteroidetes bacterium]|nr:peptidylprolyl isomerase [Bacteroidota bacterium]
MPRNITIISTYFIMVLKRRAFAFITYTSLVFLLAFSCGLPGASAQESVDKIVAVVGRNRIILQSELEQQQMQEQQQNPDIAVEKCPLLQQMIFQKLLVEQAERDSLYVTPEEVEGQLDNRIRYFEHLYGSREKLEEAIGKTIYQLKEDKRDDIKESMMAEKVRNNLIQNLKITPGEVRAFFAKIPADSLPFYPASIEVGQIIIDPPVNPELDEYAKNRIIEIRKEITDGGKTFETAATFYSQDPGSRDNGGDLGSVGRGDMVPEFSDAAFKLQDGEISQPVKTKFGYHIIQMVKRQGDQAHLRHILISPETTSGDIRKAMDKLDSVRAELVANKITFPEAVGKYSTDENAKRTGGMVTDPQTGSSQIDISKLDPTTALMIDSLKPGTYSQPQVYKGDNGKTSCRIVYLKTRTEPHKANLKDDYSKIQEVALEQKKALKLQDWLKEKLPSYYIKLAPEYQGCAEFKDWKMNATQ